MRKKGILDPKYPAYFIFHFSIIVLSGFGIAGSMMIIFLERKIGPACPEGIYNLKQIQASLPFVIFITTFIQTLALCAAAFLLALFWSHSIAGPLVRFRRYLKDSSVKKTAREPIVFRNTDQLHGLAQAFSEMVISHKDSDASALALLVEAQKILDECKMLQSHNKGGTNTFNSKLHELKKIYPLIKNIYKNKKYNQA